MESIQDRAITLINKAGFDTLVRASEIGYTRWHGVKYKKARMSTEELEVLTKIYPRYALWVMTGNVAPEAGQTSPDYDEANTALKQHGGG